MSLSREIYSALEDIVGIENISQEPAILYSYAWRSGVAAGIENFVTRFEAVLLPADTREVQAIVKTCNRYHLQFKASSTGWGGFSDPAQSGVVKLDLRRMNHILEINEKNMYTVVEPYVIGAQLQAELMKRGFNCNLTGAGSNCSALPIAAHENIGHMGHSASYGERNQLAMEWVTPGGDIVRFGSLGSNGKWFCGDGPGPSLRGVVRGNMAPLGGLGVFTKAAMKIYHWPGPATFPLEGISPHYFPVKLPDGFMIRYLSFPTSEDRMEALRKIGESQIAFAIMGFAPSMVSANIATNNEEDIELLKTIKASVQGPGFQVTILGNSPGDFDYKKRVLQKIIEETHGKSLALLEDPRIGGAQLWRCVRITGSIRETLRATGVFGGMLAGTDLLGLMVALLQDTLTMKEDMIRKRLAVDDGVEPFCQTMEHGHYGHAELLIRYSPSTAASEAMNNMRKSMNNTAVKKFRGVPPQTIGSEAVDFFGPHTSNFHMWLRKIKTAFDPDDTSESTHYISPKK